MNGFLIEVIVPALDENFYMVVSHNLTVRDALELIKQAINAETGLMCKNKGIAFYNADSGELLGNKNCRIQNGTRLVMV
jgi:hypothetical protein